MEVLIDDCELMEFNNKNIKCPIPDNLNTKQARHLRDHSYQKSVRCYHKCEDLYKSHDKWHTRLGHVSGILFLLATFTLTIQLTVKIEILEEYDKYIDLGFVVTGLIINYVNKSKKYPKKMTIMATSKREYAAISSSLERSVLKMKYVNSEYLKRMQSELIKLDDIILESEGTTF